MINFTGKKKSGVLNITKTIICEEQILPTDKISIVNQHFQDFIEISTDYRKLEDVVNKQGDNSFFDRSDITQRLKRDKSKHFIFRRSNQTAAAVKEKLDHIINGLGRKNAGMGALVTVGFNSKGDLRMTKKTFPLRIHVIGEEGERPLLLPWNSHILRSRANDYNDIDFMLISSADGYEILEKETDYKHAGRLRDPINDREAVASFEYYRDKRINDFRNQDENQGL